MPPLPQRTNDGVDQLARILIYGPAKTRKTTWAGMAAEAGFNVILLDADDGAHILHLLSPEAQQRVQVLNIVSSFKKQVPAIFLMKLISGAPFYWGEQSKNYYIRPNNKDEPHYYIDPRKLTSNDVLVLDSWSAISRAIFQHVSFENKIDPQDLDQSNQRDIYFQCSRIVDVAMDRLHSFPCHVIVIGHTVLNEKRDKDGKKVISTREQPNSVSMAQGGKLAQHFTDVLYTKLVGTNIKFSTTPSSQYDAGSRFLEPKDWAWEELSFGMIAKKHNFMPPKDAPPQIAFTWLAAGEEHTPSKPEAPKDTGVIEVQKSVPKPVMPLAGGVKSKITLKTQSKE